MFKDLPEFVQKQVLNYLATDNFSGARALHDAWMRHKALNRNQKIDDMTFAKNFLPEEDLKQIERALNQTNSSDSD